MNRNKIIYHNTIPPIKADCLLPKFDIPYFSQKFSLDSALNKPSHEFRNDALLGMKIPLCDLSVYADCTPDPESFDEHDFMYYPELASRTQKDVLVVPVKKLTTRTTPISDSKSQREKNQAKAQKNYYRKSKFYRSTDDQEIEEQLKNAFNGQVPQGEVHLLHHAAPLCSMIDRQLAKPLNSDALVLLSAGKKYLKVHDPPSEEDQPNVAKKAFSVTEKDTENNVEKAYLYIDEDGEYNLGIIKKNLTLSSIPKKDMMRERLTATPVVFQNAPIVKRAHVSHSEGEDDGNKQESASENRKRSSSASGSQSGSDRGSNSSRSNSSSRSSSSSGSSSASMSASEKEEKEEKEDKDDKKERHRIRVKDFVNDKKEGTEEKHKTDYSHSSDNEKKEGSSAHSRSPSPSPKPKSKPASSRSESPKSKSNSSASSNSDTESKKKSEHSSRQHSPSPARKSNSDAKSNSSRSGSDADDKKSYSRSNSGSSRSNSPSGSGSKSGSSSGSRSSSRSGSSDSERNKD